MDTSSAGFPIHDAESAPDDAREAIQAAQDGFGFVPNLIGVMAEAPNVAKGYLALHQNLSASSLSPVEQQIVLLTVSFENRCGYCMAAHSGGGKQAGMEDATLDALRNGGAIPDARHEALRRFTRAVVRERGWVDDSDVEAFLDAGYDRRQLFEVLLGVSMKTLSNYVNHIAETPLDEPLSDFAWSAPEGSTEVREPVPAE